MTQRRYLDRVEHFACEWCGVWCRVEFCEVVSSCVGERETCPACVAMVEREEREEAMLSDQRGPLYLVEGWGERS